jgi:hypothetical protein
MNTNYSFLASMVDYIRVYADDPDVFAKYQDSDLIRLFVLPAMKTVQSRLNLATDTPVYTSMVLTGFSGTQSTKFTMPPNVQEVSRVVIRDSLGNVTSEMVSKSRYNFKQPGFEIQDRTLIIPPLTLTTGTLEMEYVPSFDCWPHACLTDPLRGTLSAAKDVFQLTTGTPTYGIIDRRENSLVGMYLRMLPTTGVVEERLITSSSWDGTYWNVSVLTPFSDTLAGLQRYEVAPPLDFAYYQTVAVLASYNLCVAKKTSQAHLANLQKVYQTNLKTALDEVTHKNMQKGRNFEKDSYRNRNYATMSAQYGAGMVGDTGTGSGIDGGTP